MSFKSFKYYRSKQALERINSEDFTRKWKLLAADLTGYRRMQEAEILCIWYRHYAHVFEPVIFAAFDEAEQMVGFLGMIWDKTDQELRHAGHPEYHGWLAKSECEVDFLKQVFQTVREEFPVQKLFWSVLPPGLSFDVFQAALGTDMYITYQETVSPMWDLTNTAKLQKLLKSRSIKSKFNRYKRRGNLRLDVISKSEELRKVLHLVKNQINFRHEAINNECPFDNDPNKIDHFCEQITIPDTLMAVTLWLDDQLLAFQLGIISKDYVSLRMISFDPTENKLSPGTLLFIKLGEYLTEHGYKTYDLTPGLDTYKDRFSNTKLKLYKPTIHFSKSAYQKNKLKRLIVNSSRRLIVEKLGFNIQIYRKWKINQQELPKKIRNLFNNNFLVNIKKGLAPFHKPKLIHLNEFNVPCELSTELRQVKIQRYEDLMMYKDTYPFLTRRGLLIDAHKKFGKGDVLYSVVDDNKLLWYIWQKKVDGEIIVRNHSFPIEKEGILLYDCYESSSLNGKDFKQNISEIVNLLNSQNIENVYLIEPPKNR